MHLSKLDKFLKTPWTLTKSNIKRRSLEKYTTFNSENYIYHKDHLGPTLTASGANSRIKINHDKKIRIMTPSECFRYMGFVTADFAKINKFKTLNSAQQIFTLGNSISIEVITKIFKEVFPNE